MDMCNYIKTTIISPSHDIIVHKMTLYELHQKTNNLHMRKQRNRSGVQ